MLYLGFYSMSISIPNFFFMCQIISPIHLCIAVDKKNRRERFSVSIYPENKNGAMLCASNGYETLTNIKIGGVDDIAMICSAADGSTMGGRDVVVKGDLFNYYSSL